MPSRQGAARRRARKREREAPEGAARGGSRHHGASKSSRGSTSGLRQRSGSVAYGRPSRRGGSHQARPLVTRRYTSRGGKASGTSGEGASKAPADEGSHNNTALLLVMKTKLAKLDRHLRRFDAAIALARAQDVRRKAGANQERAKSSTDKKLYQEVSACQKHSDMLKKRRKRRARQLGGVDKGPQVATPPIPQALIRKKVQEKKEPVDTKTEVTASAKVPAAGSETKTAATADTSAKATIGAGGQVGKSVDSQVPAVPALPGGGNSDGKSGADDEKVAQAKNAATATAVGASGTAPGVQASPNASVKVKKEPTATVKSEDGGVATAVQAKPETSQQPSAPATEVKKSDTTTGLQTGADTNKQPAPPAQAGAAAVQKATSTDSAQVVEGSPHSNTDAVPAAAAKRPPSAAVAAAAGSAVPAAATLSSQASESAPMPAPAATPVAEAATRPTAEAGPSVAPALKASAAMPVVGTRASVPSQAGQSVESATGASGAVAPSAAAKQGASSSAATQAQEKAAAAAVTAQHARQSASSRSARSSTSSSRRSGAPGQRVRIVGPGPHMAGIVTAIIFATLRRGPSTMRKILNSVCSHVRGVPQKHIRRKVENSFAVLTGLGVVTRSARRPVSNSRKRKHADSVSSSAAAAAAATATAPAPAIATKKLEAGGNQPSTGAAASKQKVRKLSVEEAAAPPAPSAASAAPAGPEAPAAAASASADATSAPGSTARASAAPALAAGSAAGVPENPASDAAAKNPAGVGARAAPAMVNGANASASASASEVSTKAEPESSEAPQAQQVPKMAAAAAAVVPQEKKADKDQADSPPVVASSSVSGVGADASKEGVKVNEEGGSASAGLKSKTPQSSNTSDSKSETKPSKPAATGASLAHAASAGAAKQQATGTPTADSGQRSTALGDQILDLEFQLDTTQDCWLGMFGRHIDMLLNLRFYLDYLQRQEVLLLDLLATKMNVHLGVDVNKISKMQHFSPPPRNIHTAHGAARCALSVARQMNAQVAPAVTAGRNAAAEVAKRATNVAKRLAIPDISFTPTPRVVVSPSKKDPPAPIRYHQRQPYHDDDVNLKQILMRIGGNVRPRKPAPAPKRKKPAGSPLPPPPVVKIPHYERVVLPPGAGFLPSHEVSQAAENAVTASAHPGGRTRKGAPPPRTATNDKSPGVPIAAGSPYTIGCSWEQSTRAVPWQYIVEQFQSSQAAASTQKSPVPGSIWFIKEGLKSQRQMAESVSSISAPGFRDPTDAPEVAAAAASDPSDVLDDEAIGARHDTQLKEMQDRWKADKEKQDKQKRDKQKSRAVSSSSRNRHGGGGRSPRRSPTAEAAAHAATTDSGRASSRKRSRSRIISESPLPPPASKGSASHNRKRLRSRDHSTPAAASAGTRMSTRGGAAAVASTGRFSTPTNAPQQSERRSKRRTRSSRRSS